MLLPQGLKYRTVVWTVWDPFKPILVTLERHFPNVLSFGWVAAAA